MTVIIGCGAAGTLVAANLLRFGKRESVVIVEKTGEFGPGLAYSTADDLHLLNVPAATLSAFSTEPNDFLDWAREQDPGVEPGDFLPRRIYGEYLRGILAAAEKEGIKRGNRLTRITDEVVSIEPADSGELVHMRSGEALECDDAVLAIGGTPPLRPEFFPQDDRIFDSPWQEGALEPVEGTVLLIGSGLTSVDATLTLGWRSRDANLVSISRTGLRPFAHLPGGLRTAAAPPAWQEEEMSASGLRRAFCRRVNLAESEGLDWRDVVDGIRPQIPSLWQGLDFDEQRKFLSESSREWEIRRHRMAPKVAARLERLAESGQARNLSATLTEISPKDGGMDVVLTDTSSGATETLTVERIISCAGPGPDISRTDIPLIQSLFESGRAVPDPHKMGISTSTDASVVDSDGMPLENLHLIGPLRRGELWETTAIVEIRQQAEGLARKLRRKA